MKYFFSLISLLILASAGYSQGMFPPESSTTTAKMERDAFPLRIGDKVPASVTVVNEQGSPRPLTSYKAALEILALGFFREDCPAAQAKWGMIRHVYDDYKEWKVSFVAVNTGDAGSITALVDRLKKAHIPISVLKESSPKLRDIFHVSATPTLVLLDEGGYLRYRGPFGKPARRAIEALISHVKSVPEPEPVVTEACPQ